MSEGNMREHRRGTLHLPMAKGGTNGNIPFRGVPLFPLPVRANDEALPRHITTHCIERYQLRVENLPADEVRARLSTPAILAAVKLGQCSVRLATGHRAIIVNGRILTIEPKVARKCRIGRRDA